MATVNKDFKIKHGLIVEGATATVNGHPVLTEVDGDAYILDLIGGETLITSVDTTDFKVSNGELKIDSAVSDLARSGDITNAIDALTTDDVAENIGALNQYFTDQRALDATASAYDAAGSAAAAETAAIAHTDARETAITTAYEAYADTAEADAVTTANAYTDGRETAITTAYESYADQAEADAKSHTDNSLYPNGIIGNPAFDVFGSAAAAQTAAESFATQAVADLVNGAPETLDTLNELAAALQDNPDIISDLQDIASGKQDTLIEGSNIAIVNGLISVVNLTTEEVAESTSGVYFTDQRALDATASAYDAAGSAAAAQTAAETYVGTALDNALSPGGNIDSAISNAAQAAEAAAIAHADALTTDDVEEGINNLYFTNRRAAAAIDNAIIGGTQTNISVSYNTVTEKFDFVAENGVADSTTDELAEGVNNLYFTDARAVDALEAVVPNFTAVEINSVAKQVAATATIATASKNTALSWNPNDYKSGEFLVKIRNGVDETISKVLFASGNSSNISMTEYAIVDTNVSLGSVTVEYVGFLPGEIQLNITTSNNNSTVTVVGTLLV